MISKIVCQNKRRRWLFVQSLTDGDAIFPQNRASHALISRIDFFCFSQISMNWLIMQNDFVNEQGRH